MTERKDSEVESKKDQLLNISNSRYSTTRNSDVIPGDNLKGTDYEDGKRIFGFRLHKGVSQINVISFFIAYYISFLAINMQTSFMTFILRDPDYYDTP